MAKIYGNTTATPINPDLFGGGNPDIDLSNKMDKFGEVWTNDIVEDVVVLNNGKNFRLVTPSGHILIQGGMVTLFVNGSNANPLGTTLNVYNDGTVEVNDVKLADTNDLSEKMDKFADIEDTEEVTTVKTAYNENTGVHKGLRIKGQNVQMEMIGGMIKFYDGAYRPVKMNGIGNPTADEDATNKAYVDGLVGDIETALDSIIAIQEQLIGGAE